ncbi:MAG: RdgB/HAM1 family non-canonical purine NTP pyrophosphatase [Candidatus Lokiarchaeota archaeon]|nr:RdgB/HAM1 family non-canonical purine NTP pyrophosphatase [Candidatus Lokiarchaeota archaeon]
MIELIEKLTFISGNKHKFSEIQSYFKEAKLSIKLENQDFKMIEPQVDSIESVADYKLNSIKEKIDGSYFIEDAGFFIDELRGFPGVYSAYVNRTIGNQGILRLMRNVKNRASRFVSIIALHIQDNPETFIFKGTVNGKVANEIKGNLGFGFDPIFIPNENPDYTFAEISTKKKNLISHRSRAVHNLIEFIK